MTSLYLGNAGGDRVNLDLEIVLRSNLLFQANSGGGKSYGLRRLIEQAYGHVPIIVIDPEGEFSTLREKYDFLLVGKGGDTPADIRSAKLLAHRILKLGVSAVCDIFELSKADRKAWVSAFIAALVDAPKELWRDFLIIIDEAHEFVPEAGRNTDSAAAGPLIDLAAKGRKRGYGTVAATQRLAKLNKDYAAELKNVCIGYTWIDIDRERAVETLGIPRGEAKEFSRGLKMLEPGNFYGLGRAISTEPRLFRTGPVVTTHPEPGKRQKAPPPPTSKILHLLPQLSDLPQEAERKEQTEAELRAEVAKLRRELEDRPPAEVEIRERIVEVWPAAMNDHGARLIAASRDIITMSAEVQRMAETIAETETKVRATGALMLADSTIERERFHGKGLGAHVQACDPVIPRKSTARPSATLSHELLEVDTDNVSTVIPSTARRMLEAIACRHPTPLTRVQIATLAGVKPTTGTFRNYLSALNTAGFIQKTGGLIAITDAGRREAGDVARVLDAKALVLMWSQRLSGREKDMLEMFAASRSVVWTKAKIGEALGIDPSTGTFRNYLSRLRTNGLIKKTSGGFTITPELAL